MRAVYLFKRDLRLEDNKGLALASEKHGEILPVFIFDKDILEDLKAYGEKVSYVARAIERLSKRIPIYCFHQTTQEALERVFQIYKPTHLYTTLSYSWSGRLRNEGVKKICQRYGVQFVETFENFLADPATIPQKKVFTPFYKEWIKHVDLNSPEVQRFQVPDLPLPKIHDLIPELKLQKLKAFQPEDCITRLESFTFEKYEEQRNFPAVDGSSKLSPCIRFGVVSIREVFSKVGDRSEQFIKELAWREFWYHIALHFPETKDVEFQEKRRQIHWENREDYIKAFLEGKTGYPIVDAGVRQLIQEKWLHNRVRMILASFLTKVLLVDWRIGEKFFKEHLLDYDEVVNVGNWQWSASVGADPKPFRLFNPILQAQRYDPDCNYIKKYLPELSSVPCHMLHDPLNNKLNYYRPIVNYYERIRRAKETYRVFSFEE